MKSIFFLHTVIFVLLMLAVVFPPGINSAAATGEKKIAVFAGGCFWCMEKPFESIPGVLSVHSGYTGGTSTDPTYETYAAGGHIEAIKIIYDPAQVTYQELLDIFWRQVDPTDADGQFADRGHQYSTAIYYHNEEEKLLAEKAKTDLTGKEIFKKPIITPILPAGIFYPAEEYHQDYYKKNPLRYQFYRAGSGRDTFLEKIWNGETKPVSSKFNREDLKHSLTSLQYYVTQEEGTEKPFDNAYWNNKEPGIYVDVVSGEPLFSSHDKYDSGTGWPSFSKPLIAENIIERTDRGLLSTRTEVRSNKANSHLGHVFDDGPKPGGRRYCINSAALRFIPAKDLKKEGYGGHGNLFSDEGTLPK